MNRIIKSTKMFDSVELVRDGKVIPLMEKEARSEKEAFYLEDRGFRIRVFYRADVADQMADVEITRDGRPLQKYEYAAYRIWNLPAHFGEWVDEFLRNEKSAKPGPSKALNLLGAIRVNAELIAGRDAISDREVMALRNAERILELLEELSEVITSDQMTASIALAKAGRL